MRGTRSRLLQNSIAFDSRTQHALHAFGGGGFNRYSHSAELTVGALVDLVLFG